MARIVASAVAGVEPQRMGIGPVPATRKALARAGLSIDAIGLVELNEAFAAQSVACVRELGVDPAIVNVSGGAVAVGHPLGSSGARILTTLVHEMRRLTDEYDDRLIIGEIYLPVNKLVAYYGVDNRGAHLPFNFQLITLPWDARTILAAIAEYEGAIPDGGWPNWVLGNHDQPRIASRVGRGQARVAAMLLLTLRGTPTLYYGDELGMHDVAIPPEQVREVTTPPAPPSAGITQTRSTKARRTSRMAAPCCLEEGLSHPSMGRRGRH